MKYSEMIVYSDAWVEADEEALNFYKNELDKIRDENNGIIIAWIVPDEEEGHIEYKKFNTWTDAGTWQNQI